MMMDSREYAENFMREYPKKDGMDLARVEAAIVAARPLPPWREMQQRLAAFRAHCVSSNELTADGMPTERTRYIPNAATFISTRAWEKFDAAPPVHATEQLIPPLGEIMRGPVSSFVRLCRTFGEAAMRNVLGADERERWDAMRDAQRAGRLGSLADCPLPLQCALGRKAAVDGTDADGAAYPCDLAAGFLPSRYADRTIRPLTPEERAKVEAHRAARWDEWHDWLQAAGF